MGPPPFVGVVDMVAPSDAVVSGPVQLRRRWSELRPAARRRIIAFGVAEAILKAAMLLDLRRRPAAQVRGSKKAWAASALINSAGVVPVSYFVFGRRR
jgi:hypothetical protein